jgi:small subunit ribosomal protein S35
MSTTPRRLQPSKDRSDTPPPKQAKPAATQAPVELTQEESAAALERLVKELKMLDPKAVAEATRKGQRGIPIAPDFNLETDADYALEEEDRRKVAAGFWAEGEESMGPDEDYYGDDITSLGHKQLDQHRLLREYNRLAAWEMPLLSRTFCLTPSYPSLHYTT